MGKHSVARNGLESLPDRVIQTIGVFYSIRESGNSFESKGEVFTIDESWDE